VADLDAVDVRGDLDDAVRVVAGQIGVDAVLHDDLGLVLRSAGGDEQRFSELVEAVGLEAWHQQQLTRQAPSTGNAFMPGKPYNVQWHSPSPFSMASFIAS